MTPNEYWPEWRLYLLKKLALDAKSLSGRSLTTNDFLYVTTQEAREAALESINRMMGYIQSIPNKVLAGEKIEEAADSIAFNKGYAPPEFEPTEIMNTLIELSEERDAPVRLVKAEISKEYLVTQEKKRLAAISGGTSGARSMKSFPTGPIEIRELKGILQLNPHLADDVVFQLEIDPTKINKIIGPYLDNFRQQKLIPPKGKRYLAVHEQETRFLNAVDNLEKKFGKNNISTNFIEIINIIGRGEWREEQFRFYETFFSLEKEGVIRIVDLRGLEVMFSVIRSVEPEKEAIEPFNVPLEFAKVERIKNKVEYELVQKKWLDVRFVVGEISHALPPLRSNMRQYLTLNTVGFSERQMDLLAYVMEYLLEIGGVELPPEPNPPVVITSESLRKALSGESAVIGNQNAIEAYISQIYDLCDLIEQDASAKFPKREILPILSSKEKILKILEVIHSRYELIPKEPQLYNHGITITVGEGGGQMKITAREFLAGCDINFHELEAILGTLKSEGLLIRFELIPEYM